MTFDQESIAPKRPLENTYSRRSKASPQSQRNPDVVPLNTSRRVTEDNFAQKVLELLKPTPHILDSSPLNDDGSLDEEEGEKRHCVKNVHELLESGVSNRFYDELDYLVSGLEEIPKDSKAKTINCRRQLLCELGMKLFGPISPIAASRLRSGGLLQRIISAVMPSTEEDVYSQQFAIALLQIFCNEVRRLDHFISPKECRKLAINLITREERRLGNFREGMVSEKSRKPFALSCISKESTVKLGLWLIAKLSLSIQSTGETTNPILSQDELDTLQGHLTTHLKTSLEDETTLSRFLFILEALCQARLDLSLDLIISLLDYALERLLTAPPDDVLIFSMTRILIGVSGPDKGSSMMAGSDQVFDKLLMISTKLTGTDKATHGAANDELKSLFCTLLINIVDRSPPRRSQILTKHKEIVDYAVISCLESTDQSKAYYGILLGILLADEEVQRRTTLSRDPKLQRCIWNSFSTLLETLAARRQATDELCQQLAKFQVIYQS